MSVSFTRDGTVASKRRMLFVVPLWHLFLPELLTQFKELKPLVVLDFYLILPFNNTKARPTRTHDSSGFHIG